jgi:TPR repeat protein
MEYLKEAIEYEKNNNYYLAEKSYLKAIENGNIEAMYLIGNYYITIESNEVDGIKYYTMAANHNYEQAIDKLIVYYKTKANFNMMIKYCNRGIIEIKNNKYLLELGNYYYDINHLQYLSIYDNLIFNNDGYEYLIDKIIKKTKDISSILKYLEHGVKYKNIECINKLIYYYDSNKQYKESNKYYFLLYDIKKDDKIIMDLYMIYNKIENYTSMDDFNEFISYIKDRLDNCNN